VEERKALANAFHISIVDDDDAVREALARLLRAHGYLARTFESAAALLASDQRARTDCLIVDMQMPGMTGLELHARLLADGERIPTILITGHPVDGLLADALRAGVLCYLTKPCDEVKLLEYIGRAVERR
jgi:FixJ family two-component response regulator